MSLLRQFLDIGRCLKAVHFVLAFAEPIRPAKSRILSHAAIIHIRRRNDATVS